MGDEYGKTWEQSEMLVRRKLDDHDKLFDKLFLKMDNIIKSMEGIQTTCKLRYEGKKEDRMTTLKVIGIVSGIVIGIASIVAVLVTNYQIIELMEK